MNKTQNSYSDVEHLELVARRIAESGADLTSDYKSWMDVTFACASLGEQARESYHLICSQYAGYKREECDEKFSNCLKSGRGVVSLGTLMKMASDCGIDTSLPRGRRTKSSHQKKQESEARMSQAYQLIQDYPFGHHNGISSCGQNPQTALPHHNPVTQSYAQCTLFAHYSYSCQKE